jgi:hypothetical protein
MDALEPREEVKAESVEIPLLRESSETEGTTEEVSAEKAVT